MIFKRNLFSNDIQPACVYCKYGFLSCDGQSILCERKGVCALYDRCRHYRYAPLKRVPKRPNLLPQFDKSDFEL